MTKQMLLDLRLKGFVLVSRVYQSNGKFNKNES